MRPDGIELTYLRLPVEETFFRMLRHREFEVAEMSLSSYVVSLAATTRGSSRCPCSPRGRSATAHIACTPRPDQRAGGPARQGRRHAGVPAHRLRVGARHPGRPLRRAGRLASIPHRRAGDARPRGEARAGPAAEKSTSRRSTRPVPLRELAGASRRDPGARAMPSPFVAGRAARTAAVPRRRGRREGLFRRDRDLPDHARGGRAPRRLRRHPWVAESLTRRSGWRKAQAYDRLYDSSALRTCCRGAAPSVGRPAR